MKEISGIMLRALTGRGVGTCAKSDADYLRHEWRAAVLGWLQAVPAPVVNRPRPGRNLRLPSLFSHASQFAAAGLHLARVLVTDSDAEARRFFRSCGRSALLIPGCAGRPTPVRTKRRLPEESVV